ncbi:S1 family peptidase [Ferrimonas balearica]|uniref:S1 family peptidase n=1 Tax=Ferrimonas balearica TaxID=44012 RepID=UPI001C95F61E|nr:serine protease [Ferrimonas balearica]MBY6223206.1 serine protease [Ferrimonas balearica]
MKAGPFLVLASILVGSISNASEFGQIIGGRTVSDSSQHIEMVSLQWQTVINGNTEYFHICGGTVIAPDWVLTAAHCVEEINPLTPDRSFSVVHGDNDISLNTTATRYPIGLIVSHEGYTGTDGGFLNDIALLNVPSISSDRYSLISNQGFTESIPNNTIVTATGWGNTQRAVNSTTPYLQYADLSYLSPYDCSGYLPVYSNFHVCAGDSSSISSTCQGDSGGPLWIYHDNSKVQIGITSYGTQFCGENGQPAAFTNLGLYGGWIKNVIESYGFSGPQIYSGPLYTTTISPSPDVNVVDDSGGVTDLWFLITIALLLLGKLYVASRNIVFHDNE